MNEPDKPLFKTISEMALQAAFNDPRFEPLTQDEFNNIKIEISVLTKPERVENINEIKVGRDGLIIKKGFYSGLLLPQVASEFNWNRQEFLEHTCIKAGLPKNAWEYSEIYKFSAEVFGLS